MARATGTPQGTGDVDRHNRSFMAGKEPLAAAIAGVYHHGRGDIAQWGRPD